MLSCPMTTWEDIDISNQNRGDTLRHFCHANTIQKLAKFLAPILPRSSASQSDLRSIPIKVLNLTNLCREMIGCYGNSFLGVRGKCNITRDRGRFTVGGDGKRVGECCWVVRVLFLVGYRVIRPVGDICGFSTQTESTNQSALYGSREW